MCNTAWQNGRRAAGKEDPYLADLRVHDLRHRRDATASGEHTREHRRRHTLARSGSITGHYSVAQIDELVTALSVMRVTMRRKAIGLIDLASRQRGVLRR